MRRKGEQRVTKRLDSWGSDHPVAYCMATGDPWFYAWMSQKATPLARQTGISWLELIRSTRAIAYHGRKSMLARAWDISAADLIASMPYPGMLVE